MEALKCVCPYLYDSIKILTFGASGYGPFFSPFFHSVSGCGLSYTSEKGEKKKRADREVIRAVTMNPYPLIVPNSQVIWRESRMAIPVSRHSDCPYLNRYAEVAESSGCATMY